MSHQTLQTLGVAITSMAMLALPAQSSAFCGFYVGGADATLYNDATMVVMMRRGNTTVLSIQNDYSGPAEDFALVVPVPEVLDEDQVRALPSDVFSRVDRLTAPRLVEYWEQDPCNPSSHYDFESVPISGSLRSMDDETESDGDDEDYRVTVEAEFAVGEYDIVVLSAEESTGLERWLQHENYNIPEGASETLRPYVLQGTKFFVAKVAIDRAQYEGGRAVLSPLRMHYQTPTFSLPIRLGMLSSRGQQELIVHVLSENQRYEAANYDNVMIPTNLVVNEAVSGNFAGFYRSLFDRVTAANPGAVVTEYSWSAGSCDPCPSPPLDQTDLMTLGADIFDLPGYTDWTLTRLHFRYDDEVLGEDIVFRQASRIHGGRGTPDREGKLHEQRAAEWSGPNNFQGRYIMLHPFEGDIDCREPQHGFWGGPPNQRGYQGQPNVQSSPSALTADPSALAQVNLSESLADGQTEFVDAPRRSIGVGTGDLVQRPTPQTGGCASCSATGESRGAFFLLLGLSVLAMRRRRR